MIADDDPEPFAVGRLLAGKYRLEKKIAEGGIGVVMRAQHIELDQPVAIKYLKPEVLAKPVLVERFKREAQLAASIKSDHVVRVFDVGAVEDGTPYMVMEFLEGEDLGTWLATGPLPCEVAVDYVIQACDALAEAHALGIVHRDLKPENLFVVRRHNTSPILKILDFGISKTYARKKPLERAPRVRQMTEVGERFGTPLYMSPEQLLRTHAVDERTDIWSLGVVLYELVTGELPFDGDSVPAYGANVVNTPALPLRAHLANASEGLELVIQKCLEKNPDDRYRNVAELVVELATFVSRDSVPRIGRIKRVVLEAGDSIRPPRPLSQPEITLDEVPAIPLTRPRRPRATLWVAAASVAAAVGALATVAAPAVAESPAPVAERAVVQPFPGPTVMEDTAATSIVVREEPEAAPVPPPTPVPVAPKPHVGPPRTFFDYSTFGERR